MLSSYPSAKYIWFWSFRSTLNILEQYFQQYFKKWGSEVKFWWREFRWVGHQSGRGLEPCLPWEDLIFRERGLVIRSADTPLYSMMVRRLLEGGAYLWPSALLEEIRSLYNYIYKSIVYRKQMVWQTRFIFTLLIKLNQKIYVCVTWSMRLHKRFTRTKHTSRLLQDTRASVQRCSIKKVFLKIFQNPQGNIYSEDSLR